MSKQTLRDVIDALESYPKPDFNSMPDKALLKFRFVELNTDDYKRLTAELRRRKLI